MPKKITESHHEKIRMIKKIINLNKEEATHYFDRFKNDTPAQATLRKTCRQTKFVDIPLDCLLYLWVLAKNVTIDVRFKAKVSYLARVNEHNHPRLDKFFTLEESNEIDRHDEEKLFEEIYQDEMKHIRRETFTKEDMNKENSLDGWNS